MRKALFFFFLIAVSFLAVSAAGAQELVVFNNDTAMTAKGHSEKDGWVFIKLNEGEFAVPKAQIKKITKLDGSAISSPKAESSAPKISLGQDSAGEQKRELLPRRETAVRDGMRAPMSRMQNLHKGPKQSEDNAGSSEGEDDDEGGDEGADDDEDGPPEPPQPPAPVPQMPMQVNRPGTPSPVLQRR